MNCPSCGTALPSTAHYCRACGHDLGAAAGRRSFAVKPDEQVRSFRLVSTIMPTGAAERPRTYQIAFGLALLVSVVAVLLGWTPVALMVAALAVPIVYIVYLYDVNLWKDAPVPVTALAFGLTLLASMGFTWAWTSWRGPVAGAGAFGGMGGGRAPLDWAALALTALLVPVVGELLRQVGPVLLASRPRFDDLMDGLTFGIISGVAYATGDTLVRHGALLTGGFHAPGTGAATWTTLMLLEGFVKPMVIGTATGLACAEFSGLGRGYDGLTRRYVLAVLEAMGWNALYFGGTYLFGWWFSPWVGVITSIVWGVLLLGVLLLRVRTVLQTALLEAALEDAARFRAEGAVGAEGQLDFCPACEMPLLPESAFCAACGMALRSSVAGHRRSGSASVQEAGR